MSARAPAATIRIRLAPTPPPNSSVAHVEQSQMNQAAQASRMQRQNLESAAGLRQKRAEGALLTDYARSHLDPGVLEESFCEVPIDGTIPQDVLEQAIKNLWALPRAWREYLGWTRQSAAAHAGVPEQLYIELEEGFEKLTVRNKIKLASALGLQLTQLLIEDQP